MLQERWEAFATTRDFFGHYSCNNQAEYFASSVFVSSASFHGPHVLFEVDSLILAKQFARHLPWTCRSENLIALADTLSNQTIDECGHFGCVSLRILFTCPSPLLHPFCQIFSLLLSVKSCARV